MRGGRNQPLDRNRGVDRSGSDHHHRQWPRYAAPAHKEHTRLHDADLEPRSLLLANPRRTRQCAEDDRRNALRSRRRARCHHDRSAQTATSDHLRDGSGAAGAEDPDRDLPVACTKRQPRHSAVAGVSFRAKASFVQMAAAFAVLNPHLALSCRWGGELLMDVLPTAQTWRKWRACDPTSAHWYNADRFSRYIAAHI